jgi:hypothetical protein
LDELKKIISEAVHLEFERAYGIHGAFNSTHEGHSVIREEVEEAEYEMEQIKGYVEHLWKLVKVNSFDIKVTRDINNKTLDRIEEHSVRLACEAIQVAAMAKKFKHLFEE